MRQERKMDIQATLSILTSQPPKRSSKKQHIGTPENSMTKTALAISIGMALWAILVLLITL